MLRLLHTIFPAFIFLDYTIQNSVPLTLLKSLRKLQGHVDFHNFSLHTVFTHTRTQEVLPMQCAFTEETVPDSISSTYLSSDTDHVK